MNNLRHKVTEAGLTTAEIAYILNVKEEEVLEWVNSKVIPPPAYLVKFCQLINVSYKELFNVAKYRARGDASKNAIRNTSKRNKNNG